MQARSARLEGKSKPERLTLRERACLQGFPITFQFFAASYSLKGHMIGNAIPPLFAYYVAHAYLKATGLHFCLLLNFGKPRLEIKRVVRDL
jgi:site-specific DNA-cytosine methylase